MSEETTTQQPTTQAPQQPAAQAPEFTINDLNALRSIVEIATQRGAFKANELSLVGQTYDKLNVFLTSLAKGTPNA